MDEGKAVDGVYLDFSKPLATFSTTLSWRKLAAHGFHEQSLLSIKLFGWPGPERWSLELHPVGNWSSEFRERVSGDLIAP